jgi:hypothetical protein
MTEFCAFCMLVCLVMHLIAENLRGRRHDDDDDD